MLVLVLVLELSGGIDTGGVAVDIRRCWCWQWFWSSQEGLETVANTCKCRECWFWGCKEGYTLEASLGKLEDAGAGNGSGVLRRVGNLLPTLAIADDADTGYGDVRRVGKLVPALALVEDAGAGTGLGSVKRDRNRGSTHPNPFPTLAIVEDAGSGAVRKVGNCIRFELILVLALDLNLVSGVVNLLGMIITAWDLGDARWRGMPDGHAPGSRT
eukprot:gene9721-7591_t